MKLLFSETQPDYDHYLYPYVIWGFLEPGETPADAFESGFMPATPHLDCFFMVRQVRVPFQEWQPNSENRRVLHKGEGIRCELVPREKYDYSDERRAQWLAFAEERFGPGVMPQKRLDGLMNGAVISHVLVYREVETGQELGAALMYMELPRVAFYYFAFYDQSDRSKNLGIHMMTRFLEFGKAEGWEQAYIGTCVTRKALYKLQFEPMEYFAGWGWSREVEEVKRLVGTRLNDTHRLVVPAFAPSGADELRAMAEASPARWKR